jgi:foldase protein PrsA
MADGHEKRSYTALLASVVVLIAAGGLAVVWFRPEPDRVTVQHLLVSFLGAGAGATRTKAEAEKLAGELLKRADEGEDFDALEKQYSDDPAHPGIYPLVNTGVKPTTGEYERAMMVPAFGDVAFKLRKDRLRLAPYDPQKSPYGWHILKRLR